MTEQNGIELPWQPELHKPALPFVICTNGEGHYWIAHYDFDCYAWYEHIAKECVNDSHYPLPLAWIEIEKFVPFVKKKKRHYCESKTSQDYACGENIYGDLCLVRVFSQRNEHIAKVEFCPWCGFKGENK